MRESIARAQRELANPNFRDIDARFRKQLIELETTKMATTDLEKFHKARRDLLLGAQLHSTLYYPRFVSATTPESATLTSTVVASTREAILP